MSVKLTLKAEVGLLIPFTATTVLFLDSLLMGHWISRF